MGWFDLATIGYGTAIGIALGLTGGGGSIFAVPLLIYGLGAGVREAVGISLAAVGATALFGAVTRWRSGQLEFRTGLLFAGVGMLGAPLGTRIGEGLSPATTLSAFAGIMVIAGIRMWRRKAPKSEGRNSACQRDDSGDLKWTSRCAVVLALAGLVTGILSGIFGVGGGFIIVPALILTSGMGIHRAVATSLMVIALICASGVASYLIAGSELPPKLTGLFVTGGIVGMLGGNLLSSKISGPALNRVFAVGMWVVAGVVLAKNLM